MTLPFLIALLGIAVATGMLTGLTGASGMSVLISGLLFAGIDIREIIGLTFVVTLANGVSSAIPWSRRGFVSWTTARNVGLAACVAVIPGYFLGELIPAENLKWVMIAALLLAGIKLLISPDGRNNPKVPDRPREKRPALPATTTEILFGVAAGIVMGILGGGGGIFIALVLILAFRFQAKRAIGTSIVIMAIAAVPGLLLHAWQATIPWQIAAILIPVSVATAFIAARTGRKVPDLIVKRMLGIYLVLIVAAMLWKGV